MTIDLNSDQLFKRQNKSLSMKPQDFQVRQIIDLFIVNEEQCDECRFE